MAATPEARNHIVVRGARTPNHKNVDLNNTHRSQVVKAFLAEHPEIDVEWLPPYAPELNPEEDCHGNVKDRMKGATPETEAEIREQADRGFARLRRRPDLLLGFFRHAGLHVKRFT